MPAPSPAAVLDSPPPLTPAALRNFPYQLRAFPIELVKTAAIWPPNALKDFPQPKEDDDRVE